MIDRRKVYYIVVDTETIRLEDGSNIAYDIGLAVVDRHGNYYYTGSYLVSEIVNIPDFASKVFYQSKLINYKEGVKNGDFIVASARAIHERILKLYNIFNTKAVCAYNANFDIKSLNTLANECIGTTTFFPSDTVFWCIHHMACDVLYTQKTYLRKAVVSEWYSPKGNVLTNAETGYKYISGNTEFEESHTGLEDVKIEVEIFIKCLRQHKHFDPTPIYNAWKIPQESFKEMFNIVNNID